MPHPNQNALQKLDPQPILDRLQNGESLRQIAADIGVHNTAIRAWLLREDREQYQHVITAALTHRVAEADDALDGANDMISIARAREQARFSRMDLERRRPQLYGVKQQLQVQHTTINPDRDELLRSIQALARSLDNDGAVLGTAERVDENDSADDEDAST